MAIKASGSRWDNSPNLGINIPEDWVPTRPIIFQLPSMLRRLIRPFFVFGGTTNATERHLLIMVSYFDHIKKVVSKPVVVYDKQWVDDPYDDAAISIDDQGYLWVFVSGRLRLVLDSFIKGVPLMLSTNLNRSFKKK